MALTTRIPVGVNDQRLRQPEAPSRLFDRAWAVRTPRTHHQPRQRLTGSGPGFVPFQFPGFKTGAYVVPDDLGLVDIDRAKDIGMYVEAGVWVQYPEAAGPLVGPAEFSRD
jgi:hypothetical protein